MDKSPKLARKILILVAACAAVAALAVFLANASSKRELVTVAFVGHTNIVIRGIWGDYELAKLCIFRGTNGTSRAIGYYARMEYTTVRPSFEAACAGSLPPNEAAEVPAGQPFTFSIKTDRGTGAFRLKFWYYNTPTKWERSRRACSDFFSLHKMHRIAHLMEPGPPRKGTLVSPEVRD